MFFIEAYKELELKLGDPAVLADQHEYNKLAKSFSDQGPLVAKARDYIQDLDDLAEAKEMLSEPDMKEFAQEEISRIEGEINLPGSKSLSKRALLLAALAKGTTTVTNLLDSDDIRHMLNALKALGVNYQLSEDKTCC